MDGKEEDERVGKDSEKVVEKKKIGNAIGKKSDEKVVKRAKAIIMDGSRFLLMSSDGRRKLPGGHLEGREGFEEALEREIMEETGLRVTIIKPISDWRVDIRHEDWLEKGVGRTFLCRYEGGDVRLNAEHDGFEWVPLSKAMDPRNGYPDWLGRDCRKAETELRRMNAKENGGKAKE